MSLDPYTTCEDFSVEDMFFSRTDARGGILSGNATFQRVSGFEWDDLIGAPHKIVRHPDMPKGFFHLLWNTIKAKDVIGGYVCNRTKSGDAYWVYATVFPLEDGFLSVRIKPTTELFQKVIPLYNDLAEMEHSEGLTPEQSSERLRKMITDLGFFSYQEFMAIALTEELQARIRAMGATEDPTLAALSKTLHNTSELEKCAERVHVSFRDTNQIPYNMRLQAGRIEGSDGPISVISGNHRQMSQGLEKIVGDFGAASRVSTGDICTSSMEIAMARVLADMRAVFVKESEEEQPQKAEILALLAEFASRYRSQSLETLASTVNGMRRFRKQSRQMRRALSGLELTRIMCKIERFKIGGEHSGLDEIVNRLAAAQKSLESSCDEIERISTLILGLSESLLREQEQDAA